MVEVFGQLLLSPFHLVYNRRPLRGSGLPFRGCRSFLGVSVIVYLSRVRAVPYRRGPCGRGVARVAPCSLMLVFSVMGSPPSGGLNVRRASRRCHVRAGVTPPRSVSGLPRSQRQTIPSVTRRHSILTVPGLVGGGAAGAVFRHHDAGASLRAAAVTTCRWR